MDLPKPRSTPRGWRDGFQVNQPGVQDEKAIEAQNIMNEISNSTSRKKDPLSVPSGDETQVKFAHGRRKRLQIKEETCKVTRLSLRLQSRSGFNPVLYICRERVSTTCR